uniref:carbonic anhydrase n=1 Tax=viral metagenome TaxID=1070528 RepID=A0A6C0H564_9ZZZZ
MSCTSPIDISIENVKGKCDLKCSFTYNYNNISSAIAKNNNKFILLSLEKTEGTSPVSFNNKQFYVSEIRLYQPSLHSFRKNKKNAEIIIIHQSVNGDDLPLLVCIPISVSNSNNSSSLSSIIQTISNNAPDENNKTTVNSFSINDWLPSKSTPFFTYQATTPYPPCNSSVNFIVYNIPIYINQNIMNKIKNIIQPNDFQIKNNVDFFINKNGAITSNDNEIYIDCKPSWVSDEIITKPQEQEQNTEISPDTLNYIYLFLFSCFIFAILFFINYFFFVKKQNLI